MTSAILLSVAIQTAACLPVNGDHIRAGDMAKAIPAFASLPPEQTLGYSPAPGATRVFRAPDLDRIARQAGIRLDRKPEVCFQWRLAVPSKERFREAMQQVLEPTDAEIEILETSRHPAPPGTMAFPRSSLRPPPPGDPARPVVWKGYIEFGERRRFAVWARVRITAVSTRLVAAMPIKARERIRREQVRLETYRGFPFAKVTPSSLDQVVGQVSRRSLKRGDPIPARLIERPFAVRNGDLVEVRVENGAAVIRAEARAESRGRRGDTIRVRNMNSGKTFRAKVTGPNQVTVTLSGG